jgi:REP element-mobilizing transposase RayT
MPRKARIDTPGALQHVIVRGIERRNIFFDDMDRDFEGILRDVVDNKDNIRCLLGVVREHPLIIQLKIHRNHNI